MLFRCFHVPYPSMLKTNVAAITFIKGKVLEKGQDCCTERTNKKQTKESISTASLMLKQNANATQSDQVSATTRASKISCGNVGDKRSRVKPTEKACLQASLPNSLFVKQVSSWTRQALCPAYKNYWLFGCGSYDHQAHSRMLGKNKHGFQVSNCVVQKVSNTKT